MMLSPSSCVAVITYVIAVTPFVSADTCSGRCGQNLNTAYTCQCNSHCVTYGDCCNDYRVTCLGETCKGRCDYSNDDTKPCQCNTHCTRYEDCCPDYQALCSGKYNYSNDSIKTCQCNTHCTGYDDCCLNYQALCLGDSGGSEPGLGESTCDLSCTAQLMWDKDNRISQITLNYQGQTTTSGTSDAAASKLFTGVDETAFQSQTSTFSKFIALLDNYNPTVGQSEDLSPDELAEIDTFVEAVFQTEVMSLAYTYLKSNGYTTSQTIFLGQLKELWFNLYSRSSSGSILDSSGFEHAMIGEHKTTVSGFHNWIQFYLEEKNGRLNYLGWISKQTPNIVAAKFEWNGRMKTKGSFFVGVSPEFDLAIYTLCALTSPNSICSFSMAGQPIRIQTWDVNHKSGSQIGSAYPVL